MKQQIELWGVSSDGHEEFVSDQPTVDAAKTEGEALTKDMKYYNFRVYSHTLLYESDWA